MRQQTLEAAREKLGEAEFAAVLADGQALSLEEAADAAALVECVVNRSPAPLARSHDDFGPSSPNGQPQ